MEIIEMLDIITITLMKKEGGYHMIGERNVLPHCLTHTMNMFLITAFKPSTVYQSDIAPSNCVKWY